MLVVSLFVQFAALSAGQTSNTLWNQFPLNKSTYCNSTITQLWIPNRTLRRQSGYSAVFICFMMIYCCGYFVDYHCIIHTLDRCPCPGSTSAYLFISNGCIGGVKLEKTNHTRLLQRNTERKYLWHMWMSTRGTQACIASWTNTYIWMSKHRYRHLHTHMHTQSHCKYMRRHAY